jgi:hypothetical protein
LTKAEVMANHMASIAYGVSYGAISFEKLARSE